MNKKIIASVLAVAFTFSMVVGSAGAVTIEELSASIADLLNQITVLKAQIAGTGTGLVCFTTDLQKGMTSDNVKNLQIKLGVTPTSGYFGPITLAAVKTFQTANGIINTGYVGPLTRAQLNTLYCTPVVPTTTTTVAPATTTTTTILTGGAGSVENYDLVTGLSNEEVGESANDVKVAGLEIEVDVSSDLKFTAVQLTFNEGTADSDFDNYADEVSVWLEDKEIARVDADVFNDDNEWTKTVTLSGDNIIAAGATKNLYVKVSGINNLDSDDDGETWTVDFASIRFMDAQNAVISEDPGQAVRTFSFETYATAADTELKLALDEDAVNDAHVLNVDDTDATDDVAVLSFTIEIEGDSDVTIDEIPVEITTGGMNIDDSISSVYLYADEEVIGTENTTAVDTDDTITFDDLDYTIDAGDTISFEVRVDINDLDATGGAEVANGDTIQAQITAVERALIEAEDESGEDLAAADMTGTAVGDAHAIYDTGITLSFVSVTAVKTAGDPEATTSDSGTFTITFDVTAFDGDAYIDHTAPDIDGGATESDLDVNLTGGATGTVTAIITSPTGADDGAQGFLVEEDATERFSISTNILATGSGYFDVELTDLLYALTDVDGDLQYIFNLDDYKTASLYLYDY